MAEHARSRKEALRRYEQGVAAGERALGVDAFQREVGRFTPGREMKQRVGQLKKVLGKGP